MFTSSVFREKLEEAKEIQKLRERPHGISAVALAVGKKVPVEEEITAVSLVIFKLQKSETNCLLFPIIERSI